MSTDADRKPLRQAIMERFPPARHIDIDSALLAYDSALFGICGEPPSRLTAPAIDRERVLPDDARDRAVAAVAKIIAWNWPDAVEPVADAVLAALRRTPDQARTDADA